MYIYIYIIIIYICCLYSGLFFLILGFTSMITLIFFLYFLLLPDMCLCNVFLCASFPYFVHVFIFPAFLVGFT